MNKTKTVNLITLAAGTLLVGSLLTGCSIDMKHGKLNPASKAYTDSVNLHARATGSADLPNGANGRVGWGRATIFAIPLVSVNVNGDGNAEVMKQIQDALTEVGYKVQMTEGGAAAAGKTLNCQVEKFRFSNYTWLFPIVPTWGKITLNVSLVGPDQSVLWTHRFSGSGITLNFFDGYTSAARQSTTDILNEMVAAFASDEFHDVLTK